MELHGWQQCQRKPLQCTGTLSLLPPSWDTISCIYSQVLKVVSKFPYSKRLVLYFAYNGTTVKLDLGDVKAAGVVCILGLGVSLGTLFIYRLYNQYIRPFLDTEHTDPEEENSSSDCTHLVDSSDSGVDGAMGNNSSGQLLPVYYSSQYGVALGGKGVSPNHKKHTTADTVRLRRMGTRQKPVQTHTAERDITKQGGGGAHLSPSLYGANFRDSFYSTAESGFETLPECNEEEVDSEGDRELSQSLQENYSSSSLKERNERYFSVSSGDRTSSSPSAGKTVQEVETVSSSENDKSNATAVPVIVQSELISSSKSSPAHKGRVPPDARLLSPKKFHSYSHSEEYDYDPSLDASESIRSFNSSGDEYSWEEEKDLSPHPPNHTAMSDNEFRQSLMQRIREWSALAKSRSPTPECSLSPQLPRSMRRSHSLDRHIGEPAFIPEVEMSALEPIELEDCTIKNFECLETKCHFIQDDVESVMSKLHELSQVKDFKVFGEGGPSPHKASPPHQPHPSHRPSRQSGRASHHSASSSHHHHHHHRHAHRTTWERMPSVSRSDSSRSSRASSVDYSWDLAELGGAKQGEEGEGKDSAEADGLPLSGAVGPGGDGMGFIQEQEDMSSPESGKKRVTCIGEAVDIMDYAEKEWKGDTPKAKTIKQGYFSIPELFHCKHLRQVRGDNYCALRSSLFQVLVSGHKVTHRWPGLISIVDRLHELHADSESGFQQWNFAGRLSCDGDKDKFNKITHCVLSLYATIEEMIALPSEEERLARTLSLLNNSEQFDLRLMEGLKLMMLFRANDLQHDIREGLDVPTFAWLLFARDTSPDITSFVTNHLNCVGDSAGIDQVEMCLLGDCFGVKLRVARLDHHGQQEFDCIFPDEAPDDWSSVCLLAEDDRHYNVPVA